MRDPIFLSAILWLGSAYLEGFGGDLLGRIHGRNIRLIGPLSVDQVHDFVGDFDVWETHDPLRVRVRVRRVENLDECIISLLFDNFRDFNPLAERFFAVGPVQQPEKGPFRTSNRFEYDPATAERSSISGSRRLRVGDVVG